MFKARNCLSTYSELRYLALCSKKCSLFCFCFIDRCGWSLEDHFILKCCSSYFFFFTCETCSLNGFISSNILFAYSDVWLKKSKFYALALLIISVQELLVIRMFSFCVSLLNLFLFEKKNPVGFPTHSSGDCLFFRSA